MNPTVAEPLAVLRPTVPVDEGDPRIPTRCAAGATERVIFFEGRCT